MKVKLRIWAYFIFPFSVDIFKLDKFEGFHEINTFFLVSLYYPRCAFFSCVFSLLSDGLASCSFSNSYGQPCCVWHAYIFILHDILHKCAHYHNGNHDSHGLTTNDDDDDDNHLKTSTYAYANIQKYVVLQHTNIHTNTHTTRCYSLSRVYPYLSITGTFQMPAHSKCVCFNAQQTHSQKKILCHNSLTIYYIYFYPLFSFDFFSF